MKALDLIEKLKAEVAQHGNLDVVAESDHDDHMVVNVEVFTEEDDQGEYKVIKLMCPNVG